MGLEVGTAMEDFRLPDVAGNTVALSDFLGRRALLVYWNPQCGFCDMVAEDLARMESRFRDKNAELILLAYGNAESNRKLASEHKLKATILLIENSPAQQFLEDAAFQYCGTPSAYLIDEKGRVNQPLARGLNPVLALTRIVVQEAEETVRGLPLRSLRESHIEREGLKAGTPAPEFSLPGVDGKTVELNQFRGRKVLLVFSDPQCAPCDRLAPQLAELHRQRGHNGLALVMVGRGDREKNRQKVQQYEIEFPVALQDRWKLSKQYGTFATPAAFLIGQDGVLMRNVATGADAIMKLAREGLASN